MLQSKYLVQIRFKTARVIQRK